MRKALVRCAGLRPMNQIEIIKATVKTAYERAGALEVKLEVKEQ